MTIIFQKGGNFWIEQITLPDITLTGGEGFLVSSAMNLERSGIIVGAIISCIHGTDVAALASLGFVGIATAAGVRIAVGDFIENIRGEITKQATSDGGSGTVGLAAVLFMRKRGPR